MGIGGDRGDGGSMGYEGTDEDPKDLVAPPEDTSMELVIVMCCCGAGDGGVACCCCCCLLLAEVRIR